MRRDVLIAALSRVVRDIHQTGLVSTIDDAFERARREKSDEKPLNLEVFQKLSLAYAQYGEPEKSVLAVFEIEDLFLPAFWMVMSSRMEPGFIYGKRQDLKFVLEHAPQLISLLSWKDIPDADSVKESDGRESGFIRIILPDDGDNPMHPDRLTGAIKAVVGLYEVYADLLKLPSSGIGVAALDSGSDKSLIFVGLGDVAAAVRGLITDIWDRVFLGKNTKSAADLLLIAQALPVMEQITHAQDTGVISPEHAELMRRKAVTCAVGVVDGGAITRSLETRPLTSPRTLVSQRQILLTGPAVPNVSDVNDSDSMVKKVEELEAEIARLRGES